MLQPRFQFVLSLLAYTVIVRLLPYVLMNCDVKSDATVLYYPWNFSPLTAVCLFGGAYLADRRLAFVLPLATLFVSDLGIWALSGRFDWAFPAGRWIFTYFSFAMAIVLGSVLRGRKLRNPPMSALPLGLGFEAIFFAVSNFLVWFGSSMDPQPMYPSSAAGLMECYIAGLPFFGKSLLGTAAFTLLLFSPVGVRAATEEEEDEPTGELAHVRVK